jgi:hypothetical protein
MKRQITGLHAADRCAAAQIPDGVFLVTVQRAKYQRQAQKPYYTLAPVGAKRKGTCLGRAILAS